jgi:hypothetical protein
VTDLLVKFSGAATKDVSDLLPDQWRQGADFCGWSG